MISEILAVLSRQLSKLAAVVFWRPSSMILAVTSDTIQYEACLKNIEHADHFILPIGNRVGGWYDEFNRISITQREYRAAYERHQKGLLRIIILVRSEVLAAP